MVVSGQHVAVVGAGVAGLITAHTLLSCGYQVTIYEENTKVGGVWSKNKRYPGVTTQSPKDTYAFTSFPMPSHYPEFPSGEEVQAFLEAFARDRALEKHLRLGKRVEKAEQEGAGWTIKTATLEEWYDILIVTTGTFSHPNIPDIPTDPSWEGSVLHTSQIPSIEMLRGKNVVVLGYGRSACDMAVQASTVARTTTLVFQRATWRFPRYFAGFIRYSYLLLTRFAEAMFLHIRPTMIQRLFNGPLFILRWMLLYTFAKIVSLQVGSPHLIPDESIEAVASSSIYLASEGLVEGINKGNIRVHHGTTIERLEGQMAHLSDGQRVEADIVVCGTGWKQSLPSFLPSPLRKDIVSPKGDWLLYRHLKPASTSNLFFNGFNYSLFCPLTFEVSAVWIASCLARTLRVPPEEEQRRLALEEVEWMRERTSGRHAQGTSLVPFSMTYIDELLDDMGVRLGRWSRIKEWFLPIDPSAYGVLVRGMIADIHDHRHKGETL